MTTHLTTGESNDAARELEGDLRRVVGEGVLINLALEAATTVASQLPAWRGAGAGPCSPQLLLTLFTYSYAAGTYASEEIEWACKHDAAVRYLSANAGLDEEMLRAFRRANRPWIEACLAWLLERVGETHLERFSRRELGAADTGDQAVTPWLSLARRRLERALLMDMALAD